MSITATEFKIKTTNAVLKPSYIILFVVIIIAGCTTGPSEHAIQAAISLTETAKPTLTAIPQPSNTPTVTSTAAPTSTSTSTPTPTFTPTPTPKPLTQAALEKALISLDDLPAGWAVRAGEDKGDEANKETFTFLCQEYQRKAIANASVDFQKAQLGSFLLHSVTAYPPGEAGDQFAKMRSAVDQCATFKDTQDGTTTDWTVTPISFPKLGDQSFAIRLSSEFALGIIEVDSVYIRIGDTITSLQYMVLGLQSIDSTQTELFARLAEEKLLQVHEIP
jgi:hypothetical protein